FTFKKPGQQIQATSLALKQGPVASCSSGSLESAASPQRPSITKQVSDPVASRSTERSFGQLGANPIKSGLQTSITSFTRNKQVAVAAVLPQRSNGSSLSSQEKKDPAKKGRESFALDEMAIEIFDDDDDFELAAFSQAQALPVTSERQKGPSSNKTPNLIPRKRSSIQNFDQGTPERKEECDLEEEITSRPKRRRTVNVIASDDEDENDNGVTERFSSQIGQRSTNIHTEKKQTAQENDICEHPLLSRKIPMLNQRDIASLQEILLRVADEVCDIVCNISTGDLMKLVSKDYERLQKLLSARKQIRDLNVIDLNKPQEETKSHTPMSRSFRLGRQDSPITANIGLKAHSTPISNISAFESAAGSSVGSERNDSPFPCLNSFYDTKTSQSRTSSALLSAETTFKTDCVQGNSFVSGQRNFSSISNGAFSRNNSFDDLFESQKFQEADRLIETNRSFQKRDINITDHGDQNKSLNISSQSSKQIDDIDYDDEMEVAMMYDEDECNFNGYEEDRTAIGQHSMIEQKSLDDVLSQDADELEGTRPDRSLQKSMDTEDSMPGDNKQEDYTAVFGAGDHDDGTSPEFSGMNFEHSDDLQNMFRQVFGLKEFRHNQLPAINAALLGNDCFILMPTGGGKSLCYQLPAIVTNGVSIIVSPLRALIQDQTQRLLSLDIPAAHLSSDVDTHQAQSIYSGLFQRSPAFKLLYVTPEKLSASEKLLNCLDSLYKRHLLNRFVIDEAHCVSHWGHDFRPDYKKLNVLRQRYPGVPMMALTATATPRVRKDIIHQLSMTSPKWFMQSFNRHNLKYTVHSKKPSSTTNDIIEIIKTKFKQESGIVYCLSRKECDSVAKELQQAGIQAESYHAGLDDCARARVQDRWLSDDNCKVICATIAFGMGIDKSDVRFVIHYSLPKSVEGYYQEAGRAGRDGVLSYCILFYSYQDVKRLRRMLDMDQNATYESKRVHIDNLFRMISYCENVTDCRRCQILQYFGECSFDRSMCAYMPGAVCDNCQTKNTFSLRDVTADAMEIVKCVKHINSGSRNNFTLIHLVDIFKGSNTSKIQSLGHSKLAMHGRGKNWTRADVERLCRKLVIERILKEDLVVNAQDHTMCYVKLGPKAVDLMQNKVKVELAIQGGRKRADVAKVGTEPQNSREKIEAACLAELRALAKKIAAEHNMKNYSLLFPESALKQLAQCTPITKEEMIEQIDHFNATIVEKYQAHRFLEITLKYSMELTALDEEEDEGDELLNNRTSDGEWASHYFEDTSSGSTRGRGRGFQRGGKRRFFNKGKGKSQKTGSQAATSRKKKTVVKKDFFGQYQYNAKNGKTTDPGFSNRTTVASSERKVTNVTKNTLGLMPDPRSRSFLAPSFSRGRGGSL
ncbi:hypothetical protein EGW08_011344, partial [Elysia chlorotica]